MKSEAGSASFAQKAYLGAVGRLGIEGAWEVQLEFQMSQITAGQLEEWVGWGLVGCPWQWSWPDRCCFDRER